MPGLFVHLENTRPITGWGEHNIPPTGPRRNSAPFRACRNYQLAWWLRTQRGAPDAPPGSKTPKRPGLAEQMPLM